MRKRVLLVTRNFPPLWGGMERLNLHMLAELAKEYDIRMIAPEGASAHAPTGVFVTEVPLKPLSWFLVRCMLAAILESWRWRPDVVLAGSGLTAPVALVCAKLSRGRSIAYAHGLDMTVQHRLYRKLWYPAIRHLDSLIANSSPTKKLAEDIVGVDASRISVIHPGVSLPSPEELLVGAAKNAEKQKFCRRYRLNEGPLLLSVGRLTERKGLREFVRDVLPLIVSQYPNVSLAIVGDAPTDSLYATVQSSKSIREAAKEHGVEQNLFFLGKLFGQDLAHAYQAADVHVFPIRDIPNDPEGFGMVAVESAAYGVPTVAYRTGGVVDAVEDYRSGRLVEPGNSVAFAEAIFYYLNNVTNYMAISSFSKKFCWSNFGTSIIKSISG